MDTETWEAERQRLQREVAAAIGRLNQHMGGAQAFVHQMPGGTYIAFGEADSIISMLRGQSSMTPYLGED